MAHRKSAQTAHGKSLLSSVSVIALGAALGAAALPGNTAWADDFEIGGSGTPNTGDTLINDDTSNNKLSFAAASYPSLHSFNIKNSAEITLQGAENNTTTFQNGGTIAGAEQPDTSNYPVFVRLLGTTKVSGLILWPFSA